jgi:alkanesulfonate monooxygenase SsuD/methylene tetrahydromethanopterin reductase-like flavin-dependent oxidoreductase (luciferase family)
MTKYGRGLRFGYCLLPTATEPTRPAQLAKLAETLGLNYIGIQGHEDDVDRHDTWTLLSAIGAATSRITLIAKGDDLPLRPPAALAKAAASLDLLTNGRVELDLGARAFLDAQTAMGNERDREKEALAALEEAIYLMRLLWSGERPLHFEGNFFAISDEEAALAPARRINIWLDVNEPQDLMLTGRIADGWIADDVPRLQPDELANLSRHIDDGMMMAGRKTTDLQRIWRISGTIADEESDLPFNGTAKQWAERLADLALNVGIDTFLLMEGKEGKKGEDVEAQLEKFAREVVPLAQELVELAPGVTIESGISRAVQGAAASGPTRSEEETDNVDWVDETSMESFPASDPPASSSFT